MNPEAQQPRKEQGPRVTLVLAIGLVLVLAAVVAAGTGFATGEPGGAPTNHTESFTPGDPDAKPDLYVVASGAAPDGERYELVLERYDTTKTAKARKRARNKKMREGRGRQRGRNRGRGRGEKRGQLAEDPPPKATWKVCLSFEWPNLEASEGSSLYRWGACGEQFPPAQAWVAPDELATSEGTAPAPVAANTYGVLTPAPHTREYLRVYGFARPEVDRVQVRYKTSTGELVDAPVELTRLSSEVHARLGSSQEANVFVSFLPCEAGKFYDPATEDKESTGPDDPYEVIAYGGSGNELSRVSQSNVANGFQRCD